LKIIDTFRDNIVCLNFSLTAEFPRRTFKTLIIRCGNKITLVASGNGYFFYEYLFNFVFKRNHISIICRCFKAKVFLTCALRMLTVICFICLEMCQVRIVKMYQSNVSWL